MNIRYEVHSFEFGEDRHLGNFKSCLPDYYPLNSRTRQEEKERIRQAFCNRVCVVPVMRRGNKE